MKKIIANDITKKIKTGIHQEFRCDVSVSRTYRNRYKAEEIYIHYEDFDKSPLFDYIDYEDLEYMIDNRIKNDMAYDIDVISFLNGHAVYDFHCWCDANFKFNETSQNTISVDMYNFHITNMW